MKYTVESIEDRRVTFTESATKSCVAITIHRDDKEGQEGLKALKVGDEMDIEVRPIQAQAGPDPAPELEQQEETAVDANDGEEQQEIEPTRPPVKPPKSAKAKPADTNQQAESKTI